VGKTTPLEAGIWDTAQLPTEGYNAQATRMCLRMLWGVHAWTVSRAKKLV